jgi:uncharacterized membrane protein YeiH
MTSISINSIELLIEVLGTLAFALSGLIAGLRKRFDLVGICMVSGVTAFGGGTLRDVILDRRPFFWVENSYWLWGLIALCLIGSAFLKSKHIDFTEKAIQIPDALGLGLFATLGTQIALIQHMDPIVAVLMGVFTAVFGGILRDIFCNEVPKAFSDHQPYAIIAFIGGWVYVILIHLGVTELLSSLTSFLSITIFRLVAINRNWQLPKWNAN